MLFNGFLNVPDALQAIFKDHEIAGREGIVSFPRFDDYLPFQEETFFVAIINMTEAADFFFPDGPLPDLAFFNL